MFPCGDAEADRVASFAQGLLRKQRRPVVVGVQGVQGVGKSHLCERVAARLDAVVLSLDDFYLPRRVMGVDAVRGWPGTHDLAWLVESIDALKRGDASVRVPRYDKSAHGGRGDRAGEAWIEDRPSIVLVEGWCVGFSPLGLEDELDRNVRAYADALSSRMDGIVVLVAPAIASFAWRERAEASRRDAGLGAMTREETHAFVEHYQPVYARYLEALQTSSPLETDAACLHLPLHVEASDYFFGGCNQKRDA